MLASLGASAQVFEPKNLYFSGFLERYSLGQDETSTEISSLLVSGTFGYWVRPGVGLEVEAGFGVIDDSIGNLDADLESELAVSLRFESPPRQGLAAYFLFGYVRSSYELSVDDFSSSLSLPGGRIGAGLTYLVSPLMHVDVGVTHHDYDEDTRVNSFRIGVRYSLKPQE